MKEVMATSKKNAKRQSTKNSTKSSSKRKKNVKYAQKNLQRASQNESRNATTFINFKQDFIPKHNMSVLTRKNPDGTVTLMNLNTNHHFYSIDGIAAEFWNLIDGRATLQDIKLKLLKKYKPPLRAFENGVKKLLSDLSRDKLITSG